MPIGAWSKARRNGVFPESWGLVGVIVSGVHQEPSTRQTGQPHEHRHDGASSGSCQDGCRAPWWSGGQAATPARSRPWRLSGRSKGPGARRGHRRPRGHTSPATARPGGGRVREVHGGRALCAGRAPLVPTRVAVTPGRRMTGVGARSSPPVARFFTTSPLDWTRAQGAEPCQTNHDSRIQEIMTRKSSVG